MHIILRMVFDSYYSMNCILFILFYALYSMNNILCISFYEWYSMHSNIWVAVFELIITRMWIFLNILTPMCIAHTNQILRSCKFWKFVVEILES